MFQKPPWNKHFVISVWTSLQFSLSLSNCLSPFFPPSYLSVFVRLSVLRRVSSLPFPFCFLPSVSVFSATHSLSPSVSFEDLRSLLIYWGVLSAYKAPVKISDAITLFCIASREKPLFRFSGGLKVWRRFSKKKEDPLQFLQSDATKTSAWKIQHGKKWQPINSFSLHTDPFLFSFNPILPIKMCPFTLIFNLVTQRVFAFYLFFFFYAHVWCSSGNAPLELQVILPSW